MKSRSAGGARRRTSASSNASSSSARQEASQRSTVIEPSVIVSGGSDADLRSSVELSPYMKATRQTVQKQQSTQQSSSNSVLTLTAMQKSRAKKRRLDEDGTSVPTGSAIVTSAEDTRAVASEGLPVTRLNYEASAASVPRSSARSRLRNSDLEAAVAPAAAASSGGSITAARGGAGSELSASAGAVTGSSSSSSSGAAAMPTPAPSASPHHPRLSSTSPYVVSPFERARSYSASAAVASATALASAPSSVGQSGPTSSAAAAALVTTGPRKRSITPYSMGSTRARDAVAAATHGQVLEAGAHRAAALGSIRALHSGRKRQQPPPDEAESTAPPAAPPGTAILQLMSSPSVRMPSSMQAATSSAVSATKVSALPLAHTPVPTKAVSPLEAEAAGLSAAAIATAVDLVTSSYSSPSGELFSPDGLGLAAPRARRAAPAPAAPIATAAAATAAPGSAPRVSHDSVDSSSQSATTPSVSGAPALFGGLPSPVMPPDSLPPSAALHILFSAPSQPTSSNTDAMHQVLPYAIEPHVLLPSIGSAAPVPGHHDEAEDDEEDEGGGSGEHPRLQLPSSSVLPPQQPATVAAIGDISLDLMGDVELTIDGGGSGIEDTMLDTDVPTGSAAAGQTAVQEEEVVAVNTEEEAEDDGAGNELLQDVQPNAFAASHDTGIVHVPEDVDGSGSVDEQTAWEAAVKQQLKNSLLQLPPPPQSLRMFVAQHAASAPCEDVWFAGASGNFSGSQASQAPSLHPTPTPALSSQSQTARQSHTFVLSDSAADAITGGVDSDTAAVSSPDDLCYLFLVLDGHGGHTAASFAATHLPARIAQHTRDAVTPADVVAGMREAFLACDAMYKKNAHDVHMNRAGCCALATLIRKAAVPTVHAGSGSSSSGSQGQHSRWMIFTANAGDCRALLGSMPASTGAAVTAPSASAGGIDSRDAAASRTVPAMPGSGVHVNLSNMDACGVTVVVSADTTDCRPLTSSQALIAVASRYAAAEESLLPSAAYSSTSAPHPARSPPSVVHAAFASPGTAALMQRDTRPAAAAAMEVGSRADTTHALAAIERVTLRASALDRTSTLLQRWHLTREARLVGGGGFGLDMQGPWAHVGAYLAARRVALTRLQLTAVPLSVDHTPSNKTEVSHVYERSPDIHALRQQAVMERSAALAAVAAAGGSKRAGAVYSAALSASGSSSITDDSIVRADSSVLRVAGSLAVTRALGDLYLKDRKHSHPPFDIGCPYITADPEITWREVAPGDRFLVMACDGVWDSLSNVEAVELVAHALVDEAWTAAAATANPSSSQEQQAGTDTVDSATAASNLLALRGVSLNSVGHLPPVSEHLQSRRVGGASQADGGWSSSNTRGSAFPSSSQAGAGGAFSMSQGSTNNYWSQTAMLARAQSLHDPLSQPSHPAAGPSLLRSNSAPTGYSSTRTSAALHAHGAMESPSSAAGISNKLDCYFGDPAQRVIGAVLALAAQHYSPSIASAAGLRTSMSSVDPLNLLLQMRLKHKGSALHSRRNFHDDLTSIVVVLPAFMLNENATAHAATAATSASVCIGRSISGEFPDQLPTSHHASRGMHAPLLVPARSSSMPVPYSDPTASAPTSAPAPAPTLLQLSRPRSLSGHGDRENNTVPTVVASQPQAAAASAGSSSSSSSSQGQRVPSGPVTLRNYFKSSSATVPRASAAAGPPAGVAGNGL